MNHWIVKVTHQGHTGFAHMEAESEDDFKTHPAFTEIDTGPCDTAVAAWIAWHKKHGNLKTDVVADNPA
ncbi:MAG TPA: hypothetical protein VK673_21875 [Chthoniobacterales bacterium]|nr:hypothetical protein [Chthoniobacterales bacterium]